MTSQAIPLSTQEIILTSPITSPESIDRVFEYAWHRCNAFDERSVSLKKRYRRIRESIILISWLTTLLAVLKALSEFRPVLDLLVFGLPAMLLGYLILTTPYHDYTGSGPIELIRIVLKNIIDRRVGLFTILVGFLVAVLFVGLIDTLLPGTRNTAFQFMLVVLPLLSTGMLAFAGRFEAGVAWVGFRIVAEAIRRQIYFLRVKLSLYPLTEADLESLRTLVLDQRTRLDEMGIITPLWGRTFEPGGAARVQPLWRDDPEDDGYSAVPIDKYVDWRLIHQTNYYRERIRRDYGQTRMYRAWILFVGALGAFLAAIGYGEFVAVTVAGASAIQAWLSLREHEQSYSLHARTLLQLEDRMASYHIALKKIADKKDQTEADRQAILSFVNSVEDILDEERRMWRASVLQGQEAAEASLTQLVSATSGDWTPEEAEESVQPIVVLPAGVMAENADEDESEEEAVAESAAGD